MIYEPEMCTRFNCLCCHVISILSSCSSSGPWWKHPLGRERSCYWQHWVGRFGHGCGIEPWFYRRRVPGRLGTTLARSQCTGLWGEGCDWRLCPFSIAICLVMFIHVIACNIFIFLIFLLSYIWCVDFNRCTRCKSWNNPGNRTRFVVILDLYNFHKLYACPCFLR